MPASRSEVPKGEKIENHNSNRSIWGRNQRILLMDLWIPEALRNSREVLMRFCKLSPAIGSFLEALSGGWRFAVASPAWGRQAKGRVDLTLGRGRPGIQLEIGQIFRIMIQWLLRSACRTHRTQRIRRRTWNRIFVCSHMGGTWGYII